MKFTKETTQRIYKNFATVRAKRDKLTSDKGGKSLMWIEQTYNDQGEKAGKLLLYTLT